MPYNPQTSLMLPRRGLNLAPIAAALGNYFGQQAEQNKSRARQTKALQTYLGEVDPDNGDKYASMGLEQLQGEAQAFPVKRAQQQKQAGITTLMSVLGSVGAAMPNTGAPSPDFQAALMQGRGPIANPPMTPGPSPLKTFLLNAAKNPAVLDTPAGQAIAGMAFKFGMIPPKVPTFGTDANGRTFAVDPTGRVQWQPNQPRPLTNNQQPVPADWTPPTQKVGQITYYQSRPGGDWKPLTLGEQTDKSLQTKVVDGKTYFRSGDLGQWKLVPDKMSSQDFVQFMGGADAGVAGAAPTVATPPPPITDTPQSRADAANKIAQENPDWTRSQILDEVNKQFSGQ